MLRFVFSAMLIILLNLGISVHSSVLLYPNSALSNQNAFVFRLQPGQSVSDQVEATNTGESDSQQSVSVKDMLITDDGAYSLIGDNETNTQLGSWTSIQANTVSVPAGKATKVPFSISVPTDVQSGEYAAGIAFTEIKDPSVAGPVNVKIRKALRVYTLVGTQLRLDSLLQRFDILDPKDGDFTEMQDKLPYFGRDNMVVRFNAENTGNVFATLEADYKIQLPDGTIKQGVYKQSLAPRVGPRTFYIITNQAYQPGRTTISFNYRITPLNATLDEVEKGKVEGEMSDFIELTQSDWSRFAPAERPAIQTLEQKIEREATKKTTVEEEAVDYEYYLAIGIIIVSIVGLVFVLILKLKPDWRKKIQKRVEKWNQHISTFGRRKPITREPLDHEEEREDVVDDDYKQK